MIRIAIIGYGNIGRAVMQAIDAASDMQLAGVVRRKLSLNTLPQELADVNVTDDIATLGQVDVAILCVPSRLVPQYAEQYLKLGINTIDSFDIHNQIYDLRQCLKPIAQQYKAVSIISAGWDPGSDSVVRSLLQAIAPNGLTYTNFGPGRSMGHSVAVKAIEGVEDALSITIPLGTGIHRRMVYVKIKEGYLFDDIKEQIKADDYFRHDETHVFEVDDIETLNDVGHAVNLVRKGVSGTTHNQLFEFNMHINNPALTGQVLVACARASVKLNPGAYTMIEIPPIAMLEGNEEQLIKQLV